MRVKKTLLYCLLVMGGLLTAMSSCTKQDIDTQLFQQEESIDKYINSQLDTTGKKKKQADTVYYKGISNRLVLKQGVGDTLAAGDSVEFYYDAYVFSNGKGAMFDSNIREQGTLIIGKDTLLLWPLGKPSNDFGSNVAGAGKYISGLDAGLVGVREREHAYIMFTAKYGYENKQMGVVPKMTPLLFEVWIRRIIKK